jgi:putative glutamine amidotransferase
VSRRPLIGVTADIEWHAHATPPRLHYELDAHLARCLFEAGATVVVLPHDDAPEALCERLDGVVLSGGAWVFPRPGLVDPAPAVDESHKHRRARFELTLARWAIANDRPLLGICGGFQVLNAACGGLLDTDLALADPIRARHAGPDRARTVHGVTPVAGTRFATLVGEAPYEVNSQHRQGLATVGATAMACAHADDGLVEAIECSTRRFCIGAQWHPEFLLAPQDRALLRAFVDAAASVPACPETCR